MVMGLEMAALGWVAAVAAGGNVPSSAATLDCRAALQPSTATNTRRAITTEDLARLRDIGSVVGYAEGESPWAISPSGDAIAFQLRRADPTTNSYCLGMMVLPVRSGAKPLLVDLGGELIRVAANNRGMKGFPSGTPRVIRPRWSPDGRWIAYLRQDESELRIWRAAVNGGSAEALSPALPDFIDFAWSADGNEIIYSTDGALDAQREALKVEGRRGYAYDTRFWPVATATPFPNGPVEVSVHAIDIASRTLRAVDATATPMFGGDRPRDLPGIARAWAKGKDGGLAWTFPLDPGNYNSSSGITARIAGYDAACGSEQCRGRILKLWWADDGQLLYLRQEGIAGASQLGLYRWSGAVSSTPERILATDDMLVGCEAAKEKLLCGRESSTRPRRLVLIDLATGKNRLLFDPNPEFDRLALGKTERMSWRSDDGTEAFGDLVLPNGYKPGDRPPLIIVQYRSRGFLRGGMGDEYPIFPMAARGFAVLSVDRPPDFASRFRVSDVDEQTRLNVRHFADRKRVLASIEAAIDMLDDRGLIDPKRVGITGLSDGAATVQFALVNSKRFAAAAMSSCCEEPGSSFTSVGPAYRGDLERWGYPERGSAADAFWRQYSIVQNVERIETPLLLQLSDDEFRLALGSYVSLAASGKAVDLFVFENEHHIKWQPAHRLAIYDRSLAWFDFWLNGTDDIENVDGRRWKRLKEKTE